MLSVEFAIGKLRLLARHARVIGAVHMKDRANRPSGCPPRSWVRVSESALWLARFELVPLLLEQRLRNAIYEHCRLSLAVQLHLGRCLQNKGDAGNLDT